MTHTPGPWKVHVGVAGHGMGFNDIYHAFIKSDGGMHTVAFTKEITGDIETEDIGFGYVRRRLVNHRPTQRDPHPDALLIAAAPDMLEALKGLVGESMDGEMFSTRIKAAMAAIAKAEGRT